MTSADAIYADLKLADRMTPGRTPWQTLRKRAEELASADTGAAKAREILRSDWDENGTSSIYLPRDIAMRLLEQRGWHAVDQGGWITWTISGCRPLGTDEALQFALVAEAV